MKFHSAIFGVGALSACLASIDLFAQAPGDQQHAMVQTSNDAAELKSGTDRCSDALIGFTLGLPVTNICTPPGNGHPPKARRAMVMDLKSHKSYELLKSLHSRTVSTTFEGWLSDHRSAIVEAKLQDGRRIDDYWVDVKDRHPFTPTGVEPESNLNGATMPFRVENESGYVFAANGGYFKMNFDGGNKRKFLSDKKFGHGCRVSPPGNLVACEMRTSPPSIEVFDVESEKSVYTTGPTPNGMVSWSPDGAHFVYMRALNETPSGGHENTFTLVKVEKGTWFDIPMGGGVVHSLSPCSDLPPAGTPFFANGSELGQWSARGDAYYNSVESASGATKYNRIGIILLSNTGTIAPTFTPLTPEGMDARFPALAPSGDSFIFLGRYLDPKPCGSTNNKRCESPVQIYRYDSRKQGRCPKQISHFPKSQLVVYDLHWRSLTEVPIKQHPYATLP
jgi:hypothetical protein